MADHADERLCWLALDAARVPGRARALVQELGAARVLEEGTLAVSGRPGRIAWDAEAARALAQQALAFLARGGLALGGADGAALGRAALRRRPPLFLYGRGEAALLARARAVAIVGTRRPTPIGLTRARHLAEALVERAALVVSGGARGIDRAAHEAALEAGGETIAVLGQPIRPVGDERRLWMRQAFDSATGRALSVTPFGPGVPHDPRLFAARNWTLAALSDAVVVVEGTADSGTRHTALAALAMGIPIFTWPSDAERPGAAMPNALLAEGHARSLPGDARQAAARVLGLAEPSNAIAGTAVPPLLEALRQAGGRLSVDEAALALGLSASELFAVAAELEIDGWIRRDGAALVAR